PAAGRAVVRRAPGNPRAPDAASGHRGGPDAFGHHADAPPAGVRSSLQPLAKFRDHQPRAAPGLRTRRARRRDHAGGAHPARLANPRTLTIHPTGPMEAEEELGLLVQSIWSTKHDAQWWVPSYGRWCEKQDPTPAYEQMVRLLKLIGWSQQASSLRPWVLKTPQHMLDLPVLMKIFPDARLIFTHRDPLAVVGSAASLAWNQTVIYSDHADARAIGQEWLRKTRLQIDRMRAARDHIPAERRIDVHYEDMDRDWRGTMARVYRFLGLDIEPVLPAMEAYQQRTAALKRQPHRYSLEAFGLRAGRVVEELGDYVWTDGISVEDRAAAAV